MRKYQEVRQLVRETIAARLAYLFSNSLFYSNPHSVLATLRPIQQCSGPSLRV